MVPRTPSPCPQPCRRATHHGRPREREGRGWGQPAATAFSGPGSLKSRKGLNPPLGTSAGGPGCRRDTLPINQGDQRDYKAGSIDPGWSARPSRRAADAWSRRGAACRPNGHGRIRRNARLDCCCGVFCFPRIVQSIAVAWRPRGPMLPGPGPAGLSPASAAAADFGNVTQRWLLFTKKREI